MMWLFVSTALAAPKAELMTNFLTEDQLNAWFMKIVGVMAVVLIPQIITIWRDSKSNVGKRLDGLDTKYERLLEMVSRLEGKFDERKR